MKNNRYDVKIEIPITIILQTIFSKDNYDVESLARWTKKYGFIDLKDGMYELQDDYYEQDFYTILDEEERKQYEYEDCLIEEIDKLKERMKKSREKYYDLYYQLLCEKVDKLRPYYDIDKIKSYGVFVWNKAENIEDQDNIFDIYADGICFYTEDRTIIEEAKPIIEDIQNFIKKYYNDVYYTDVEE